MSETLIQDPEKAYAMALAGDKLRTEAAQERKMANAIKLARLAYYESADENTRMNVLNDVLTEVGLNHPFKRPDVVRGTGLENFSEDISLLRDIQIAGFFDNAPSTHEMRASGLDSLAEPKEAWAELVYDNPAVEYYRDKYPELRFDDEWTLQGQVEQAVEDHAEHLKNMPRYIGVLKDGRYVPGGLLDHLFEYRQPKNEREEFEPNVELLGLLENDDTTVAQLREFLLRQEYIALEAEKKRAEDFRQMLSDIKNREVAVTRT